MRTHKWNERDELREPGIRRVLEAMRLVGEEEPELIEHASIAAMELAKRRGDGGCAAQ